MSAPDWTLARRAVACKRWRWMPGMRTSEGWRVIRGSTESRCWAYDENPENWQVADNPIEDGTLPDLSDPATLGCLLALVRKAWNNPNVTSYRTHPMTQNPPWKVEISMRLFCGDNEVEALVAALEAAP